MHSFCASEATSVLVTTLLSCAGAAAESEIAAPITANRTVAFMRISTLGPSPPASVHQAKRRAAGRSSHDLEQPRRAHATADAHRDHDVLGAAALALDQRVPGETRARGAVGMADRDRAAVHVEALVRNAEAVAAVDHLHGEGLVQLPEPDILDLEPGALEELGHGEHRSDSHLVGLAARDREAAEDAERLELARG